MKKKLWMGLLAAASLGSVGVAQAAQKVKIAVDVPYLPMEYQLPSGELGGFDIELGDLLCEEAELECSWLERSWDGIITGLQAHKYDAIMSAMTITENRGKAVQFSNPYVIVGSAFYVLADSPITAADEDHLKGRKIGVQRGTTQDDYVTAVYGKVADVVRYDSADSVVLDVENGRLDTAFFDTYTGVSAMTEPHPDKYRQAGELITGPEELLGVGVGLAFRKGDKALASKFNRAIYTVLTDGRYDELFDKYFGPDTQQDAVKPEPVAVD